MRAASLAAGGGVARLRRQYPALSQEIQKKKLVYFDNACTLLKPKAVADRIADFYRNWGGCGGKRSTHLLSQQVEAWLLEARRAAAEFISAESPNEIIFTSGTTESVNLVARAFPYEENRREVVITDLEHNAVFLPFYEASQRGEIKLRFCRSQNGRVDLEAMKDLISDRTALVAMTRASNVYGGVQPMAEVSRMAHRHGALVLADDAQYLSSHRENVTEVNVDFAAFSSHKIGGPFGLGVLYGKENLLNRLGHYKVGGGTVKSVQWRSADPEVEYLDAPMRFEAGVPNFGGVVGFAEAVKFIQAIPQEALRAHVAGLVRRAAAGLARFSQIKVLGRTDDLTEGSLVSFYPVHENFSAADFNLYLNHELKSRFIAVRVGEHCAHLLHQSLGIGATVRLSFFAYNTEQEVDVFLDALEGYVKAACK